MQMIQNVQRSGGIWEHGVLGSVWLDYMCMEGNKCNGKGTQTRELTAGLLYYSHRFKPYLVNKYSLRGWCVPGSVLSILWVLIHLILAQNPMQQMLPSPPILQWGNWPRDWITSPCISLNLSGMELAFPLRHTGSQVPTLNHALRYKRGESTKLFNWKERHRIHTSERSCVEAKRLHWRRGGGGTVREEVLLQYSR